MEAYRKDEFIQDILLGNSIRRVVKKASGKPPLKKKPELDLKRKVVKMQIAPLMASLATTEPSMHDFAVQTTPRLLNNDAKTILKQQ